MSQLPQIFKNRKAAHAWLVSEGVAVSRGKFYEDADRLGMVQPDKSVQLCDLIAYMRTEFKQGAAGKINSPDAEARQREIDRLDLRERQLKVDKLEREKRKDDDNWMEVVDHETQMAAFGGLVEDTLRQLTTLKLTELIYLCGGDIGKAAEFNRGLEDLYATALTDAVREQTRDLSFADEDEDDNHGN